MRIRFKADAIIPRLQQAVSIVQPAPTIQALSQVCVRVKQNGDMSFLTADNDIKALFTAEGVVTDGAEDVSFCTDAKQFLSSISNMKGYMMEMSKDGSQLKCLYRREDSDTFTGAFQIPSDTDVQEYMDIISQTSADGTQADRFTVDAQRFITGIDRTLHAAANDPLRPQMCGVHYDFTAQGIVAAASDGRMLVRHTDRTVNVGEHQGCTLPSKLCNLLSTIKDTGDMTVEMTGTHVTFGHTAFRISSRLVEAKYPNYNSVIPAVDSAQGMRVDRAAFLSAIRNVMPYSAKMDTALCIDFKADGIVLEAEDVDMNRRCTENVPCEWDGQPVTVKKRLNGSAMQKIAERTLSQQMSVCNITMTSTSLLMIENSEDGSAETLTLLMLMIIEQ